MVKTLTFGADKTTSAIKSWSFCSFFLSPRCIDFTWTCSFFVILYHYYFLYRNINKAALLLLAVGVLCLRPEAFSVYSLGGDFYGSVSVSCCLQACRASGPDKRLSICTHSRRPLTLWRTWDRSVVSTPVFEWNNFKVSVDGWHLIKAVVNPVNLENKQSPIKINRLVDSAAVLVHLKFILNIERQQRTSSSTVIINSGLFLSPRPPVSAHILTLRSQSYYTQPGRWMVTTGSKWIGLVSEQCKTGAGIQHKGVRQIHHHHHHR